MEIIKIIKKKNNLYQILLSDNKTLSFYDEVIVKYNLLINKKFDNRKLQEMLSYNNEISAYYQALNYIKTKLRTKKEIENKLKNLGYQNKIIEKIIQKLEKQKYLNDDLYVKSYINDQINLTSKGPIKVTYELKKLGFSDNIINKYLDEYNLEFWQEKIKKIINKKIKANHKLSALKLQNKIKKDLLTLGYPLEMFKDELTNINIQDDLVLEKEFQKELKKYRQKYPEDILLERIKYNLYKKGFNFDDINHLIDKYMVQNEL